MKITPTAIRQKTFETGFRGYEKKDVTSFLEEISEVVDQLHKENIDLKSKLQNTQMEAKRLKDVEDSLFRTLKTAEDTGASIIEEANEAADQIIAEANQVAENNTSQANELYQSAIGKAQKQADQLVGAAEKKAQDTIIQLRESMGDLVRSYEGLVEQREALVKSLRRITQDSLNQIDLSEAHFSRLDAKAHKRAVEDLSRSNTFTFANLQNLVPTEDEIDQEEEDLIEEEVINTSEEEEEIVLIEEKIEIEEDTKEEDSPEIEVEIETAEEPVPEVGDEVKKVEETETPDEKPKQEKTQKAPEKKDSDPSDSFFDQL